MWSRTNIYPVFLLFLVVLIVASCRSRKIKNINAADIKANTEANQVIDSIHKYDVDFDYLKAVIKTKHETSKGENQSFKTFLKIKKDSAILATITFLNVPLLSTLITPDSVKLLDKRGKKYFVGTTQSVGEYFKVPVDFHNIQNVLVGNAIAIDTGYNHYLIRQGNETYLSSVKNSELPAILSGNKVYFGWMYRYWINEYYRPGKTILNNPGKGNSLEITQTDYKKIKGIPFPNKTEAVFSTPTDTINLKLNYNRVKLNKSFDVKFKIPSHYKPFE